MFWYNQNAVPLIRLGRIREGYKRSKTGRVRPASPLLSGFPSYLSLPLFEPVIVILVPPLRMAVDHLHTAVMRPERPDGIQLLEHLADLLLGVPLLPIPAQDKVIDQGLPDGIVFPALPALMPQVVRKPV